MTTRVPLAVAATTVVLALGLPLAGGQLGYESRERVLLIGTLALVAVAAAPRTPSQRARQLITAAIGLVGLTLALVLSTVATAGLVLLLIAAGGLAGARRQLIGP